MTNYRKLCTLFYDLDKPSAPPEAREFYAEHCRQANGPIHEAMCGSGRFLVPLHNQGFDLDGSDSSPDMLQACQSKDPNVKLSQQHLANLNLPRQYGLIFIVGASFSLITDHGEAKTCLKKLRDHLLPGGKLLIEVDEATASESHSWPWGGRWIDLPDGGKLLLSWTGHYDRATKASRSILRYELISPEGKILETDIEPFDLRLYDEEEFQNLLEEAGFTQPKRYVQANRETLVFLAERGSIS